MSFGFYVLRPNVITRRFDPTLKSSEWLDRTTSTGEHMVAGGFDYLIKMRVCDMEAYRTLLGNTLGSLPDIKEIRDALAH